MKGVGKKKEEKSRFHPNYSVVSANSTSPNMSWPRRSGGASSCGHPCHGCGAYRQPFKKKKNPTSQLTNSKKKISPCTVPGADCGGGGPAPPAAHLDSGTVRQASLEPQQRPADLVLEGGATTTLAAVVVVVMVVVDLGLCRAAPGREEGAASGAPVGDRGGVTVTREHGSTTSQ